MAKEPEHKQQKQYCNKFNKDFKNGPHQLKKNLKKKKESQHENLFYKELQTTELSQIVTGEVETAVCNIASCALLQTSLERPPRVSGFIWSLGTLDSSGM